MLLFYGFKSLGLSCKYRLGQEASLFQVVDEDFVHVKIIVSVGFPPICA